MNLTLSETELNEFHSFIEELAVEDKFSGSVLVARHGEVLYKKAFGMANKGFGIPNTTETKFNLGSLNKMFTAVSILKLAEDGLLHVNDEIGKHIPDGERVIGHNGGFPGVGALFNMYMQSGYTFVILSNYDFNRGIVGVHQKFDQLFFGNGNV